MLDPEAKLWIVSLVISGLTVGIGWFLWHKLVPSQNDQGLDTEDELTGLSWSEAWQYREQVRARLAWLRTQPPADGLLAIVTRNVWLYNVMPEDLQRELLARVQLLTEVLQFEGVRGVLVDDEMRITISALASLLLMGRDRLFFEGVLTVRICSDAFSSGDDRVIGIASDQGYVQVSWKHTPERGPGSRDGQSVVLHEFAHQLDYEDELSGLQADSPGVPLLPASTGDAETPWRWSALLQRERGRLEADLDNGRPTVLDAYGAQNLREFFAVATEVFFEQPDDLRAEHAELYEALRRFYGLHPASWRRTGPDPPDGGWAPG